VKLKPVLHRIFVRPDQVDEVDEQVKRAKDIGLYVELDKREQKAVVVGTVVAIGNTAFEAFQSSAEEEEVEIGSKVLYAKYSGAEVPNSDLLILNDEDVIAVVEKDN
jgi:co-chaperonin GroES (HSP10)